MSRTNGPGSRPVLPSLFILCMTALALAAASTTETIDSSIYVMKELTEPSTELCLTPLEGGTDVEAKLRLEVIPKDVGGEQLKVHLAGNVDVPKERLQQDTAGTSLLRYEFAAIDQKVTLKATLNNEELPYTPYGDKYIGRYEFHLIKFYVKGHVKVTYNCTDPLSGRLIHGPRGFTTTTTNPATTTTTTLTTSTTTTTTPTTTTTITPHPPFLTTTPTTTTTTTPHPPFTTTTITTTTTTVLTTPHPPFITTTPTKTTTTSTPAATTTTTPTTTTTTTTTPAAATSNPPITTTTTTTVPGWIWDLGAVGPVPTLVIVVLAVLVALVVLVAATLLWWCCRNRSTSNNTSNLVEEHSFKPQTSNTRENQWKNRNIFETREDHSLKNIFETGERYPSKDNFDTREEHPLMRNSDNEKNHSLSNPRCMAYNRETSFYP